MNTEATYRKWKSLLPLTQEQTYKLNRKFTVEYNYNSNHLEGNTLTYGQTEILLLFGKVTGEVILKDVLDMKASEVSVKMMQEEASMKQPLTQNFIRNLHKVLLREDYQVYRTLPTGVTTSYTIHAGRYKTRPNSVITRYGDRFEYASPEETPSLMTDLVDWYNAEEAKGKLTPVELAALFHYRYIRIHPFEDGNGRIARLLVNYIFLRHGWPMIVVRSRLKEEYLDALHQSDLDVGPTPSDGAHASINDIRKFFIYFNKLVNKEIESDIEFIKSVDDESWWYDGERIKFRSENAGQILQTMQLYPTISVYELAKRVGINKSAMQKQVAKMIKKGYVQRFENDTSWHVIALKF